MRDIAAGGQGAPLVPFVDRLLFASAKVKRVALNIGGIANITILPLAIAFDTGPGNMVIDQLTERMTQGRKRFDRNGSIAAKGHVNRPLLDSLLADKYYKAKPPKTAGREQYGLGFMDRLLATRLPMEDLIATATALTAATIATGVTQFAPGTQELIAAGGGTHNRQLMAQVAGFLPAALPGYYNVRVRHRRRCQGSNRVRSPGASDMASPNREPSERDRRAESRDSGKSYALKSCIRSKMTA